MGISRYTVGLWALLVGISSLSTDAADSRQEANTASQIIVTATRDQRSPHDLPYFVDTLSEKELRLRDIVRSVPEALNKQSAIMVQKTGHGQGSPYIRGFTGFRTLFLIDNVRLNNSVFRDGPNQYWNTVDPLSVNRLEVAKGPFSSLYGSDAVGGAVNAVTQSRTEYADGFNMDSRLYYRYSSAENANIGRIDVSGNLDSKVGFVVGFSGKEFGNLVGGRDLGEQTNTGYTEQDWNARLDYFPDTDSSVTVVHQGVNQDDAWRTHKTIYGQSWEGTKVGSEKQRTLDQDRLLSSVRYRRANIGRLIDELDVGVSHQQQKEARDRIKSSDSRDIQGLEVNTVGVSLRLASQTSAGRLVYGAEFYRDNVNSFADKYNADGSFRKSEIQGPVGDDAIYETLGIYLEDHLVLRDRLEVTLGGRYSYASADAKAVKDPATGEKIAVQDNWGAVVANSRLLYGLDENEEVKLFAGISQGFRAPNLSDLTRLDTARSDEIETPSPDLDPETFISYEIGLKAENDQLSGQLAYFYTDIRDMIVRTPTGNMVDGDNEVTKKNGGDGYVHGVEAEAEWQVWGGLSVLGNFTWLNGEVETYPTSDPVLVSEPMDRLMPPSGRVAIRWEQGDRYWVEVGCRMAAKQDKLSTRDQSDTQRIPPGGTPGYAVFDLRAGVRVNESLMLSAGIENVSDEDYRIHGSGLNEAGRNMVVAIEQSF